MERQERLEYGQKFFVIGVFILLALESLVAIISVGLAFSWVRLLLAAAAGILLLYLANRIYSGDKGARNLLVGWFGVQTIVLAAAALCLGLGLVEGPGLFRHVGAATPWLAVLLLAAYVGVTALYLSSATVKEFLADRGGEVLPEREVVEVDPGAPVAWADDQKKSFSALAAGMKVAGTALVIAGVLNVLAALRVMADQPDVWTWLVEGVAYLALGGALFGPAAAVRVVVESAVTGVGYVVHALGRLRQLYLIQAVVAVVLAAVAVVRLVQMFQQG
jgi:hypothetical protein